MERKNFFALTFTLYAAFLLLNPGCAAAAQIRPPEALIGHQVGADYKVARYEKIREYFQHVGENSRRVNVRDIGITTEGRNMIIAEITDDASPARIEQAVAHQKQIADPRLIKDERHESDLIAMQKSWCW